MSAIDQLCIAIGGYIVFSAVFSYAISSFSSKTSEGADQVKEEIKVPEKVPLKSAKKKEKLIKDNQQAYCIPCERYFDNDTYLKNHLEGAKHLKKTQNFQGDVYRIENIPKKNK